jgi:hypothetical protein
MQSHYNCNPGPAVGVTGSLKSDCTIRTFHFFRLERQWGDNGTADPDLTCCCSASKFGEVKRIMPKKSACQENG